MNIEDIAMTIENRMNVENRINIENIENR